jgi:hypothetical protein
MNGVRQMVRKLREATRITFLGWQIQPQDRGEGKTSRPSKDDVENDSHLFGHYASGIYLRHCGANWRFSVLALIQI